MCVNTKAPVSDYYGRESKVWIENKYSNNLDEDFNHKFTFEQSTNPNYKPGVECVLDGAYVYIKSSEGFYFATPCDGTYCVAASKDQSLRQVFRVHISMNPTS